MVGVGAMAALIGEIFFSKKRSSRRLKSCPAWRWP